jgi:hypothetical protein
MSGSNIAAGAIGSLTGIWCLILLPGAWAGYFTRRETRFCGQLRSAGELGLI